MCVYVCLLLYLHAQACAIDEAWEEQLQQEGAECMYACLCLSCACVRESVGCYMCSVVKAREQQVRRQHV
jgi:hypothetical protein